MNWIPEIGLDERPYEKNCYHVPSLPYTLPVPPIHSASFPPLNVYLNFISIYFGLTLASLVLMAHLNFILKPAYPQLGLSLPSLLIRLKFILPIHSCPDLLSLSRSTGASMSKQTCLVFARWTNAARKVSLRFEQL